MPVCESMADIGTDHGYLPIYLVQEGRARRAIACDVNDGPLTRAREDVSSSGLSRQIGLRLGGGLAPLGKGERWTVSPSAGEKVFCGWGQFQRKTSDAGN